MIAPKLIFGLTLVVGMSLTACSSKSGDDILAKDPFSAASAGGEDRFGKGFGKAYRAKPNSEPANVIESDVIPVSLTSEPEQIE